MTTTNLGKVSVTPKGEYDPLITYERLDVISHNGSSYIVKQASTGVTPIEGEFYALIAEKGDGGSFLEKSYKTYAAMELDKPNLTANISTRVSNDSDTTKNGSYTYDGTVFTRSQYDSKVVTDKIIADTAIAVQNAINNTAIDGGVLADTFVVATPKSDGSKPRTQAEKNLENITIYDFYTNSSQDYTDVLTSLDATQKGLVLDLEFKTLKSNHVPTNLQVINGYLDNGGEVTSYPIKSNEHPISGQLNVLLGDGTTHYWCQEALHNDELGETYFFVKPSYRHRLSASTPLYQYKSLDKGLSIYSAKSIYSKPGWGIAETRGRIMNNGRYGLLMTMREEGNSVLQLSFIYSDNKGLTWDVNENITGDNFIYSDMLPHPDFADTYFVYGYRGGDLSIAKTTDNGLNWTSRTVDIGSTVIEPSVVQIPGQNKWIMFIRTNSNLYISTSTNMDDWTTPKYTSVDLGDNPVQAVIENGKLFVYLFMRDLPLGTLDSPNTICLKVEDPEYVFSNSNFRDGNTLSVLTGLNRCLGYMRIVQTKSGNIFTLNCGEGNVPTDRGNHSVVMVGSTHANTVSRATVERKNLAINPIFDFWTRGDTFTGNYHIKCADAWNVYGSGSNVTVSKETLSSEITNQLPFRPRYGLRIQATADDFIGLYQRYYYDGCIKDFQDKIVTMQVWGMGEIPSNLQALYKLNYGDLPSTQYDFEKADLGFKLIQGDASQGINNVYGFEIGNIGPGKLWYATATFNIETLDKDFKEGGFFQYGLQAKDNEAWDCVILGVNLSVGANIAPCASYDYHVEKAKCLQYVEAIEASSNDALTSVSYISDTSLHGVLHYHPKVKKPTVTIKNKEDVIFMPGGKGLGNMSFSQATKTNCILKTSTLSAGLGAGTSGYLYVNTLSENTVSILVDIE